MATDPNHIDTKGRASASPTVVRLPTAARRKVQNYGNRDQRLAAMTKIKSEPWPGEFKYPSERAREAAEAAKPSLAHIERTPALVIAMCLYGMTDEQGRRNALGCAKLMSLMKPGDATRDAVLMMEAAAGFATRAKLVCDEANGTGE